MGAVFAAIMPWKTLIGE